MPGSASFAITTAAPPLILDAPAARRRRLAVADEGRPVQLGDHARAALERSLATVERCRARRAGVRPTTGAACSARVHVDSDEPQPRPAAGAGALRGPRPAGARAGGAGDDAGTGAGALARRRRRPAVAGRRLLAALDAGVIPAGTRSVRSASRISARRRRSPARYRRGRPDARRRAGAGPAGAEGGAAWSNANAFSVGWACLALDRCRLALEALDAAAALSFEGFLANPSPARPRGRACPAVRRAGRERRRPWGRSRAASC